MFCLFSFIFRVHFTIFHNKICLGFVFLIYSVAGTNCNSIESTFLLHICCSLCYFCMCFFSNWYFVTTIYPKIQDTPDFCFVLAIGTNWRRKCHVGFLGKAGIQGQRGRSQGGFNKGSLFSLGSVLFKCLSVCRIFLFRDPCTTIPLRNCIRCRLCTVAGTIRWKAVINQLSSFYSNKLNLKKH